MDTHNTDSVKDATDLAEDGYPPAGPVAPSTGYAPDLSVSDDVHVGTAFFPAVSVDGNGEVDAATHVDPDVIGEITAQPTLIPKRLANRVSIVGFADGHRDQAPWADDDMEYWGINRLHAVLKDKPWTRWFELHSLEDFYKEDAEHQAWLKQANLPVYVRPQDLEQANEWQWAAAPYPIERIVSGFEPSYFTNTISWLLALAIAMGFEEIQLYGVDMAQDSLLQAEYSQQRPSCEWLIGIAQGRGIRVVLPPGSDLLKTSHLYGFDTDEYQKKLMARLSELGNRKEQMRGEMNEAQQKAGWFQARISELDGAMQEVQYNLRNLVTPTIPANGEVPVG